MLLDIKQTTMLQYLVGVGGLGLVGAGLLLLELLLELLLPLLLHLLLPAPTVDRRTQTQSLRQSINKAATTGLEKWSTGGGSGFGPGCRRSPWRAPPR